MTPSEIFSVIESHEFAARLNVASSLDAFLRAAKEENSVQQLFKELASTQHLSALLERVIRLSQVPVDPRYENPGDTALAIYVWLASFRGTAYGRLLAQYSSTALQCWWSSKISRNILLEDNLKNEAAVARQRLDTEALRIQVDTTSADSGEALLPLHLLLSLQGITFIAKPILAIKSETVSTNHFLSWYPGVSSPKCSFESSDKSSKLAA